MEQIDYEKKYNDALERARIWASKYIGDSKSGIYNLPLDRTGEIAKDFLSIFPEPLNESDDEKIRRLIKDAVYYYYGGGSDEYAEVVTWLERQKHIESPNRDKVYSIMTKLTELSASQLIPVNSDEYKKIHEITSDIRDLLLECPVKQMPLVEWCLEDEKRLKQLTYNIETIRADCKKRKTFIRK